MTTRTCPNASLAVNCCQVASGCFGIPRVPAILHLPALQYPSSPTAFPYANWMEALVARCAFAASADADTDADTDAASADADTDPDPDPDAAPTLGNLVLPGSHDAATCTIPSSSLFAAVGITQTTSVGEQLMRGIRFLDLCVASDPKAGQDDANDRVRIYHGCLAGGLFRPLLAEIRAFCDDFRGECLILMVTPEHGRPFGNAGKKMVLDAIHSALGDLLFGKGSSSVSEARRDLRETALGDLVATDQRVCVLLQDRFYEGLEIDGETVGELHVVERYHCFPAKRFLRDKWHNTRDPEQLLRGNLDVVRSPRRKHWPLLNNQFVLTPGISGPRDVMRLLLGRSSLQPVHLANNGLYRPRSRPRSRSRNGRTVGATAMPLLHEFWVDRATSAEHEPWNIVSLDCVDLAPAIVAMLVGLNGVGSLEILLATLVSSSSSSSSKPKSSGGGGGANNHNRFTVCVTDQVRSRVLRESCLFLHVGPDLLERNEKGDGDGDGDGDKSTPMLAMDDSSGTRLTATAPLPLQLPLPLSLTFTFTFTLTLLYRAQWKGTNGLFSLVLPSLDASSVVLLNEHNHGMAREQREVVIPTIDGDSNSNNSINSGRFDPGYGGSILTWERVSEGDRGEKQGYNGEGFRFGFLEEKDE